MTELKYFDSDLQFLSASRAEPYRHGELNSLPFETLRTLREELRKAYGKSSKWLRANNSTHEDYWNQLRQNKRLCWWIYQIETIYGRNGWRP